LQQSCEDFELVIVDNCSTDGTTEWIEQKAAGAPDIRFYRNPIDIGMTANFNACLGHAKSEYIKFHCADDLLLPGCLQRMARALDSDLLATLAVGGRELINESGEEIALKKYVRRDSTIPGGQVINRCIFGRNYIGEPSAVMFRGRRHKEDSMNRCRCLWIWSVVLFARAGLDDKSGGRCLCCASTRRSDDSAKHQDRDTHR
jgi:glycosyltransferase involved in cell wall biosynthesis